MPFNISQFRSSFSSSEPQSAAAFEVYILPPVSLLPLFALTNGISLNMRCQSANIPGRNIAAFPFANEGYAPYIKIANGSDYDEVHLDVICSQSGLERQLFTSWSEFIQPLSQYNTNVRYFDSYTGNALIITYASDGSISQLARLQNCYPISMSSMEYSWASHSTISTFRVALSYERLQILAPGSIPGGLATAIPWPEIDISSLVSGLSSTVPSATPIVNTLSSI